MNVASYSFSDMAKDKTHLKRELQRAKKKKKLEEKEELAPKR